MTNIDPRDFGVLEQKVSQLEVVVRDQSQKIDTLIELMNRGKGAYWASLAIASGIGGIAGLITSLVHPFGK